MSGKHALKTNGKYPHRAARMAFPGKFRGRVHLNACRTGFMICPGLGPEYGRPCYDDRWGDESDWIDGDTAWTLFKAAVAGDLAAMEALLDEDPRLVNALHWYTQPVHLAARHGHADATELLLERGADPGLVIFGSTWASLLEETRKRGFDDVAEVIERTMRARFRYESAFGKIASLVKNGSADRVETALRDRTELADRTDEAGNNGLHLGDWDRVRQVLSDDAGATGRDAALKSPLAYASRAGHEEIASLLLEAGTDSHAVDEALFEAVWYKRRDVVALLLDHGANPNVELDSCGCAAGTDDPAIRDLLVRHGAVYPPSWRLTEDELRRLVDSKATRVRDPYLVAEVLGTEDEDLIDALLANDPEAPSRLEVLQYLPTWGDDGAIARKLVAGGLDPNRRTFQGETYLHACAAQGMERMALSLIEHGSELNALDEKDGQTPLAVAVKNGRIGMVRLLLKQGADPELADWPWARPHAIAEETGDAAIAEAIRRHGRNGT